MSQSGITPVPDQHKPTVTVVVPCLNEARNLPYVFARMPRDVDEVILVDGGSADDSVAIAQELWSKLVVVTQTRRGKGNALACGIAVGTGDIIVLLDADGSTDPAEIPQFVQALVDGAMFAKGSRFLPGGDSTDITRLRRLGNSGLSGLVNLLFRTRYSDLCYGYNAFWREALPHMALPDIREPAPADGRMIWGDGFEIETLVNIRMAKSGLPIAEVPSVESARLHGVSNLDAYKDGWRVLSTILREFRARRPVIASSRRTGPTPPATAKPPVRPALPTQRSHVARDHWHERPTVGNEPVPARNET